VDLTAESPLAPADASAAAAVALAAPARSGSTVASDARKQMASELSEEFCCAICCELIVQAHALSCAHTFCRSCLAMWLATPSSAGASGGKSCPTCRARITADPVPVRTLDAAIDLVARTGLSEDEQRERKEKQAEAAKVQMPKIAAPAAPAAAAAVPAAGAPFFRGGFGGFGGAGAGGGFGLPFGYAPALAALAGVIPAPVPAAPAAAAAAGGRRRRAAAIRVDADDDDDDEEEDDDDEEEDADLSEQVSLEHARSGRSRCKSCGGFISHGSVRFAVFTPANYDAGHYYDNNAFHHVRCYGPNVSRRQFASMSTIPGFGSLTAAEKREVTASRR